ncbi:uncharacterized protein B0H64DRAFT_322065 [Chaetomium fimeti]|uniref:Ubiquitin-like domain-containing protein n=1 Tax=Chaetomium fimeti TaxID=1854472 RepID=A0AAE0LSG3_9PEZI|nr:hypothetical protein B0H64DRAFT_322065 [Chaetomium fimeti]
MEALSRTAGTMWTATQRQAVAMGRMVKRVGVLVNDIREMFVFLATCSKEMLAEIGRNTRLLLRIAGQLKRVIQTIEAMPRNLGVDIIRLDDALGETWGLPLQACGSWESFCDLLRHVVFAGKPGLDQVASGQFVITLAKMRNLTLTSDNWSYVLKKDMHIEQAMVIPRARSKSRNRCPFLGCAGIPRSTSTSGKRCSTCGRQARIRRRARGFINMIQSASDRLPEAPPDILPTSPGPGPLPMQLADGEDQPYRRVQFQEVAEPLQSLDDAIHRFKEDETDMIAAVYIGVECLRAVEEGKPLTDEGIAAYLETAETCFGVAICVGT